jgi:ABC-type bacteriocin/lantibiotic exporter with double-glycine peptidase domain
MKIKEGSCVGIIGESGSGKSTLLSLMMGIRGFDSGEITSGGYLVNELTTAWQSRICYLPQDTFLFAGTLLQNICFDPGSLPADREKVKNALKVAEFLPGKTSWDDFIDSSVLGGGANLSGGQRQRVAFARAIYHDRDVMFMDEITSALDFESEVDLLSQLTLMKGHRTIIIVSHSKNILDVCDEVYEVRQGTVFKM